MVGPPLCSRARAVQAEGQKALPVVKTLIEPRIPLVLGLCVVPIALSSGELEVDSQSCLCKVAFAPHHCRTDTGRGAGLGRGEVCFRFQQTPSIGLRAGYVIPVSLGPIAHLLHMSSGRRCQVDSNKLFGLPLWPSGSSVPSPLAKTTTALTPPGHCQAEKPLVGTLAAGSIL